MAVATAGEVAIRGEIGKVAASTNFGGNRVYRPLSVATIDAVALLRHPPLVLQLRMHSS